LYKICIVIGVAWFGKSAQGFVCGESDGLNKRTTLLLLADTKEVWST